MSVAQPVIDYIDPDSRRIYLLDGITEYHPLDDIYAEVRYLRRTNEELRKYLMFIQGGGNIPKNVTGTLRTPRYSIFKNCKIVLSGDTYVAGEQLYANEDEDIIGKGPDAIDHELSPENAYVDYEPPGSEIIISGSDSETDPNIEIIKKMVFNDAVVEDNILTIFEDDKETPWKTFDLSDDNRIEQQ